MQGELGRHYGHDVLERIERIVRPSPEGGNEKRVLAYDPLGRLEGYRDVREWEGTEAVCDDPYDLHTCRQVTPRHSETLRSDAYSYDRVGNGTDRGAVVETGNRLAHFDGYTLEYDEEGNLKRKAKPGVLEQSFVWNVLDQLASVPPAGAA